MKILLCLFFAFVVSPWTLAEELPLTEEIKNLSEEASAEETRNPAEESSSEDVERIKVTGSRITRIDMEGPSPVVIYNKEDLENSGYSSVADFLRDTTVAHFGVSREQAGSSFSGESALSLKGETSLILINGMRVAEDPDGHTVDLNLIPIFAVERIEVLKDGGSALYGSDAVGGVVNFITKKDFDGAVFHALVAPTVYPQAKGLKSLGLSGGSRGDLAAVLGSSNQKWSYISSFQLRFQDKVENHERSWTNKTISPTGPYPIFGSNPAVGCPDELKMTGGCKFNVADYSTRLPQHLQFNSYFQGEYKFGEHKLYTQLIANYKNVQWDYAPIPGGVSVPAGHKMSQHTGTAGLLRYRFMEAGQRETAYDSLITDLTVGSKGYISKTWDYDFSVKLAHIWKNETAGGLLLQKELTDSIFTGLYDPFDSKKRDLSKAKYTAKAKSRSLLFFSSLDFSGETGFWDVDLATGLQFYGKNYRNIADKQAKEGNILSNAGSDGKGNRNVFSYYLEGIKNFGEMLELQLAGRVDRYSDFGWTANPKFAFRLQPSSQLLFRGSVSTAFVAPSLELLNQSSGESYPFIYDTVACYNELKGKGQFESVSNSLKDKKNVDQLMKDFLIDQRGTYSRVSLSKETKTALKELSQNLGKTDYCKEKQYYSYYEGNKKLKETKALVASLGSHLQLTENHSFTLDFWYIRKSGIPSSGLSKSTMDAELRLGNSAVKNQGIKVERDESNKYKAIVNKEKPSIKTKLLNIGKTQISGLDFVWNSKISHFNRGTPYFKNQLSYIFFSKGEAFPGLGFIEVIGEFGLPRWRNVATVGWKNSKHNISLSAHLTAPFAKKVAQLDSLPMYSRFDLDYQFIMNEKTSFVFGWSNLLFSTPPLDPDDESNKLEHAIFEARGPFLFAGIKYKL